MNYSGIKSSIITSQRLTAELANRIIDQTEKLAVLQTIQVAIAICDPWGYLIAFQRMDGAALVTIEVAIAKAKTAALLGTESGFFESAINNGEPSFLSVPGIVPLSGGIPLKLNGHIIGAIGISGGKSDQDERLAQKAAQLPLVLVQS